MVNIYVCIKQVPDTEASISSKDGKSINEANIKWIINPYDEFGIEEALKFKANDAGHTVIALSLGPERVDSALRTALAMGVDRAIHILSGEVLDDMQAAAALAGAIRMDPAAGLIFMGKQAIDNDAYQVHLRMAEELGIAVATNVMAFSYQNDKVTVEREIDEGAREVIEMAPRCVIAASKGLNVPRYASVMGIMKAKKVEIKKLTLAECGVAVVRNHVTIIRMHVPPEKPQGRVIPGDVPQAVQELVRLLKNEAKVL